LAQRIAAFRPQLRSTPEALDAARFLLLMPPLRLAPRPPYGALAAAASVAMLPRPANVPAQRITGSAKILDRFVTMPVFIYERA
jgi:hypothetical protein